MKAALTETHSNDRIMDKLLKMAVYGITGIGLMSACVDIEGPGIPASPPSDILAKFDVRSSAVMIAEGDSLQITFDVIAMNGSNIPYDSAKVEWKSMEAQKVWVTSTGMLYGLELTDGPIEVVAKYTHNHVTKYDTVGVYVTDGVIDANELKLMALDSTMVGAGGLISGHPRIRIDLYKNGHLVESGAQIPLMVDKPAEAELIIGGGDSGETVYAITNDRNLLGQFWVKSSLNLYGNEVKDSISFFGTHSSIVTAMAIVSTLNPDYPVPPVLLDTIQAYQVAPCALHTIMNLSMMNIDIVYSDSAAATDDCGPTSEAILANTGFPLHGEFIGGNVKNVPPFSIAFRKSRTLGIVSFYARESATGKPLLMFANHFEQVRIDE